MVLTLSKTEFSIGLLKILQMFYPPKGICVADPVWGPIDFSYVLSVPSREQETLISAAETKMPKCFIVWMDGRVDGGGWWEDG